MCGRFTLILEPEAIQDELQLGNLPEDFHPRYNIAPSQPVAVVNDSQSRDVQLFRWGLIPAWAKDPAIGNKLINARAETLAEKPSFRTAFARRRCLILADGFYEWFHPEGKSASKVAKSSVPYLFRLASREAFAFAGLWDTWKSPEGENVFSCTIITTSANQHVARFHDRMPVILDKDHIWKWLDYQLQQNEISTLLKPYPAEKMSSFPVSPMVNNPGNDLPQCIEPVITTEE